MLRNKINAIDRIKETIHEKKTYEHKKNPFDYGSIHTHTLHHTQIHPLIH